MTAARRLIALPVIVLAVLSGCGTDTRSDQPALEPVGLYTSLPILWQESNGLAGLLDADAPRHWVMDVLEEQGSVRPLDDLAGDGGRLALPRKALLVMAQPRPLSPDENVALDSWVRSGGRVLLFADPMLTAESSYAIGDNRRPQDVALLSPILSRWGLEMQFDEDQPAGERVDRLLGQSVPVNLPGRFALSGDAPACAILDAGLAARCSIGEGQVLAVADAALLEDAPADDLPLRRAALKGLLASLAAGDGAGRSGDSR